jgi:L-alanine-DL-glutamate epimerase-like enolase superfamily enzyme
MELRTGTRTPICGGEQLLTLRQYRPYLERHAMDTVMVDVCWQGFSAAKKVADLAEATRSTWPRTTTMATSRPFRR